MALELIRSCLEVLIVHFFGLSLSSFHCFDISLEFREERFTHGVELSFGLGFRIDQLELQISDFLREIRHLHHTQSLTLWQRGFFDWLEIGVELLRQKLWDIVDWREDRRVILCVQIVTAIVIRVYRISTYRQRRARIIGGRDSLASALSARVRAVTQLTWANLMLATSSERSHSKFFFIRSRWHYLIGQGSIWNWPF